MATTCPKGKRIIDAPLGDMCAGGMLKPVAYAPAYPPLYAWYRMYQERIDHTRHGHLETLAPLVAPSDVLISNPWLVEPTLRHTPPRVGMEL